jgi:ABC-2 type transport system permease protein
MTALLALLRRELVRFVRRPSQVVSTLATPVVIWVFLAAGFAGLTPDAGADPGESSYAVMLAPGVALLVILFATVFAGMSLIEDRNDGFLRGVLVSPAPRWSVAGSKLLAATIVGAAQAVPVLAAVPLLTGVGSALGVLAAASVLALAGVGVGGFGLALAWWVNSSRGFHGLFSVALMPLWILSGAVFPEQTASGWIVAIARVNPVGWCRVAADAALRGELSAHPWSAAGVAAFAACGAIAASAAIGSRPGRRRR